MAPKKKNAIPPVKYKKEKGCNTIEAGAQERQHAPRLVGDILTEMVSSSSPLATGYRKFLASKENSAEKGGKA